MEEKKDTLTKTVRQYSEKLPGEVMEMLREIASDYGKVKQYVYQRYSGIRSMDKLTPVYTILNEMRYCGLRKQLDLPIVYYELAIADAVTDIKVNWSILKNRLNEWITQNMALSDNEKMYLRTVLKINSVYAAILNRWEYETPRNTIEISVDEKRLNNMLRRMTRNYLCKPQVKKADSFKISPAGYSYRGNMFRIVCRIPRKRLEIPLKDNRRFHRQLLVRVRENDVELAVPIETDIRNHPDYVNVVFVHIGNIDMMTLSNGHIYGEALNSLVDPETERLNRKNSERNRIIAIKEIHRNRGDYGGAKRIEVNNLGREKYERQKKRVLSKTHTFINTEINRMLDEEKPGQIIITRPVTKNKTSFKGKKTNRKMARTFQGYIRKRLKYKCRINGIEVTEINSKGTGRICSSCGTEGIRESGKFLCDSCGIRLSIALNSAKNMEKKYTMINKQNSEDK